MLTHNTRATALAGQGSSPRAPPSATPANLFALPLEAPSSLRPLGPRTPLLPPNHLSASRGSRRTAKPVSRLARPGATRPSLDSIRRSSPLPHHRMNRCSGCGCCTQRRRQHGSPRSGSRARPTIRARARRASTVSRACLASQYASSCWGLTACPTASPAAAPATAPMAAPAAMPMGPPKAPNAAPVAAPLPGPVPPQAPQQHLQTVNTLPGFMMFSGSSARLMLRITATAPAPASSSR